MFLFASFVIVASGLLAGYAIAEALNAEFS